MLEFVRGIGISKPDVAGIRTRILGLNMPLIKLGDDLLAPLLKSAGRAGGLKDGDIVIISSKVLATSQGRLKELSKVRPSSRAKRLATRAGLEPEFVELVLREADRVLGVSKGAILTIKDGLPCVNAGVDRSNVPPGYAALMPANPNRAAEEIRGAIARQTKARVAVIVVDSSVKPLRLGTVGQAIGVAGLEPVIDCRGELDLYGNPLKITFRAVADQLATAAQLVMGEAAERIPAAIMRGSKLEIVEKVKRSPKVSFDKCLFFSSLKHRKRAKKPE